MWTAIWITLVVLAIVTPIYLLYKIVMKLIGILKIFDSNEKESKAGKDLPEYKVGVVADSNYKNMQRRKRIEIKTIRLERKYNRLARVVNRWRRYGLMDD
ncbi:hypothetical protein HCQ94_03535 [Actinomyces sp. zg-332]|uniref:hypothetical protein n=1 Tax=Actinomyces sp. zg-332 TaxID=2708340 RepID=UPI00141D863F|nr:hypothetical protein [Actinomyces sp. zg-332]QPK93679.1 hypothetical protein HCQ94_03535 [Actinomyces sp. zg-332]